ncbi:MAG: 4Fe-4S binding protein [Candidatus Cloacimonetes bacterium]|nr:4Fe-4S binding protein [Candidatus Cloacimonadota bacterium]HOH59501.1 4Fe-4S binding protein [Candidatus Cloacimonadota bacterium]
MTKIHRRNVFQALFLTIGLLILAMVIIEGRQSIHNFCPYAVVCFGFLKGNLLFFSIGVAALGILIGMSFMILSMFFGRVFCGYICPLGTLQELLFALRSKKRGKRMNWLVERKLARFKYFVLALNILLVVAGLTWVFIPFCPIYGISRLPSLALGGLAVFVLILVVGFFVERLWCRYLCPYAALLNLAQGLGKLFGIKRTMVLRNLERCIDCGICSANCPMNLDITSSEYVDDPNCIHCLRCSQKCPKPGTIRICK